MNPEPVDTLADSESPPATRSRTCYLLKQKISASNSREALEGAIFCEKTFAVAAAITSGAPIVKGGFARVAKWEDITQSECVFNLENVKEIAFNAFAGETVDTATLVQRMQDPMWCRANPDHPIAFMFFALRNYSNLVRAIKSGGLLIMIRKARRRCYVVSGGDAENNRRILAANKFSPQEIEEILASID